MAKEGKSDVFVYCGCGGRALDVVEVLENFPEIRINEDESVMKKSCLIANTANMSMAAREASIYTSLTISEYYRDMGYNVITLIDSLSR